MKIVTFQGKTPSEALKNATEQIGDEGLIIETREIRKKSLGKDALYEIVIGIDESKSPKPAQKPRQKPLEQQRPLLQESEDILYDISSAAEQISKIADVTDPFYEYGMPKAQPYQEPKELKEIKSEIHKLSDKVKLIQNMFWEEKAPNLQNAIPPEFAEIYKLTKESGMNQDHLDEIMQMTLEIGRAHV